MVKMGLAHENAQIKLDKMSTRNGTLGQEESVLRAIEETVLD